MNEKDLQTFLEENRDDILRVTKEAVLARIKMQVEYALPETFNKTVSNFMQTEIAPEIVSILTEQKGAIITAVTTAASEIGDTLAKAMVKTAAEQINSYSGRDILTKLMGGH